MKLTVKVVPQASDASHMSTCCPVANALRVAVGLDRASPKTASKYEACAGKNYLAATGPNGHVACATPPAVAKWIEWWDAMGEGEPFEFEVTALESRPSMSQMLGW